MSSTLLLWSIHLGFAFVPHTTSQHPCLRKSRLLSVVSGAIVDYDCYMRAPSRTRFLNNPLIQIDLANEPIYNALIQGQKCAELLCMYSPQCNCLVPKILFTCIIYFFIYVCALTIGVNKIKFVD